MRFAVVKRRDGLHAPRRVVRTNRPGKFGVSPGGADVNPVVIAGGLASARP